MTHPLSASWLKMMSLFIVALGLLVALGAHPTTAWPANMLADIVFRQVLCDGLALWS